MKFQIVTYCLITFLILSSSVSSTTYENEDMRDEEALQLSADDAFEANVEDELRLDEQAEDPFLLDTIKAITDIEKKAVDFGTKAIEFGKKSVEVGKKIYEVGKEVYDVVKVIGDKAHKALNAIGITDEVLSKMPGKIISQGKEAILSYAREKGIIQ